jgi:transposase-like protein
MYVQGVSTRKVKVMTETPCGHSLPASSIGQINKGLDASPKAFAERRLAEAYPYLILDARYERVRGAEVIATGCAGGDRCRLGRAPAGAGG